MARERGEFTETQEKILAVLADGLAHHYYEIKHHVDGHMTNRCMRVHICAIRKILRKRGEDVLCVWQDRVFKYRHVRLLPSACDGLT